MVEEAREDQADEKAKTYQVSAVSLMVVVWRWPSPEEVTKTLVDLQNRLVRRHAGVSMIHVQLPTEVWNFAWRSDRRRVPPT